MTGQVVYANYGRPEDFTALEKLGIDVKGKIVLVRYGELFRGLKVRNAQKRGAKGILIFSDPLDDGYGRGRRLSRTARYRPGLGAPARERPVPLARAGRSLDAHRAVDQGGQAAAVRPKNGFTLVDEDADWSPEASDCDLEVLDQDLGEGDRPHPRGLFRDDPLLPISYDAAKPILEALGGPNVPTGWQGGLPLAYHVGPGPAEVHFRIEMDYQIRTIWNVIATIKGEVEPDRWVMIGNHRDAWVYGAVDPGSGTAATLEMCRALGAAVKNGWKPRRTLVYASWDAEEYGLVGSTEWATSTATRSTRRP